jgi:hypothetical protein
MIVQDSSLTQEAFMGEATGAVNLLAVVLAAVSAFVLGGAWYSPALFGKAWQREAGLSDEQLKSGNMAKIFGGAFALSLIGAYVFAMFLGPSPGLGFGFGAGLSAGLCWVAASLGINYLFEHKSLKLFLINGAYHTAQFTLYGLIIGWMQ